MPPSRLKIIVLGRTLRGWTTVRSPSTKNVLTGNVRTSLFENDSDGYVFTRPRKQTLSLASNPMTIQDPIPTFHKRKYTAPVFFISSQSR